MDGSRVFSRERKKDLKNLVNFSNIPNFCKKQEQRNGYIKIIVDFEVDREDTSRLFVLSSQQLSKSLRTTGYRNAGIIERAKLSRYYLRVQAGLMPQSVSSTDGIPYVILSPSRLRWPTYKKFSTLFPPGLYSRSPTHELSATSGKRSYEMEWGSSPSQVEQLSTQFESGDSFNVFNVLLLRNVEYLFV